MNPCIALRGATLAMMLIPFVGNAQTLSEARRRERVGILSHADEARRGGRFDEALELIRQAEQIGATAGTRMLSAQVLSQMGRLAASYAASTQCLRDVDLDTQTTEANRAALRTRCEGLRDEVAPRIALLTVRVPAGAPSGMEVRIDDDILRSTQYGVEQAFDPSAVIVRAVIAGRSPWERVVPLSAGARTVVDVVVPEAPSQQPTPAAVQTRDAISNEVAVPERREPRDDDQLTPSSPGSTQRALAWTAGALGVALIGGAAAAGASFSPQRESYLQANCLAPPATSACWNRYDDLEVLNTLQYIGYIGGGALVVTSVILFVAAPSAHREPAVSFGVTPGGLSLGYTRRF